MREVGGDYGVEVLYGKNIVKDGFSETVDIEGCGHEDCSKIVRWLHNRRGEPLGGLSVDQKISDSTLRRDDV